MSAFDHVDERIPFWKWIGLSDGAIQCIIEHLPRIPNAQAQYETLLADPDAFFQMHKDRADAPAYFLALYALFALFAHKRYMEQGISSDIFQATFSDIARWENHYFARHGQHGIAEKEWLRRHIRLELFALGELQFEPVKAFHDPLPAAWAHLPILNVHVPEGADLNQSGQAYQKALAFFGFKQAVGVCHSWLLSPKIIPWLKPDSRIIHFQSAFTVSSLDLESRQAEERIFGDVLDDPALYAEQTSLQRCAKAALMQGEKIPSAYGYFLMQKA